MTPTDPSGVLDLVCDLARRAGAAAMGHYGTAEGRTKEGGGPVTAADHAANRVILRGLGEAFPGAAVLSEESRDDRSRLGADRVWIVDPLDGTREFLAENGEFSVMIGLAEAGEAVLGVVYRPDGDVLWAGARGGGAWVERGGRRAVLAPRDVGPAATAPGALRMVGSRSHGDPLITRIAGALGVDRVRPTGSVGLKCALVAEGESDVYVHPVPWLKEWDTCAPEAILREAGGVVTDCRGRRLEYNKPDPRQPHGILACGAGCHGRVLDVVRPLYEASIAGA